jgi:hypothetical protein
VARAGLRYVSAIAAAGLRSTAERVGSEATDEDVMLNNPALILFAILLVPMASEPLPAATGVAESPAEPAPPEGLWPSPKLLNLMLVRWAEETCADYELDDPQRAQVRGEVVAQWSGFLTENRSVLQPLANEFIEMRMTLEPPSKEQVQAWADRALPVFEKTRDQIRESHDEFRKVLRPMQRAKFEVDALQMSAGMAIAEQKLKEWKQGEFDKDVFWEPLPAERRARREERRRRRTEPDPTAVAESPKTPVDQIAAELDSWEKYVADFVQLFHLDEGQRTAALSCLSELRERAIAHRERRREEIARLEYRIQNNTATSDAPLDDLKKQLRELYGPIDDMFKELQTRLEQIPTADQRAAAVERKQSLEGQDIATPDTQKKGE